MPKELKQISFTLELPKHLVVSLNAIYSGSHWHKRQQIKQGYKALTRVLFKELAGEFGEFNVPCAISFTFAGTRIHDCDNHVYMGKMIQDCLVSAGILKGDKAQYVKSVSYEKQPQKSKIACVLVTIKECEQ
ncbi:MAG: hypothetical protein MR769_05900 [Campylobacter sp.]|uniref:hypothetical protein n=1 Tax=Campylobacter sp. TaxID=205 RepID=UPI002AA95A74|nr:hypothetical protein [Campylobacter sp.]MCI6344201.1 hypothetical protein [Campylobacter sp.]